MFVRAEAADGTVNEQVVGFAIDPSGGYSAVPDAQPLVTSTNFC